MMKLVTVALIFVQLNKVKGTDEFDPCRHYYDEDRTNPDPSNSKTLFDDSNCPKQGNVDYPPIKIAYINIKPYIYDDGDGTNPKGILKDFVHDWIGKACKYASNRSIEWIKHDKKTIRELQNYCRLNEFKCDMSVPSLGVPSRDGGNGIVRWEPFAYFFNTGGDVFVSVQGETWRKTMEKFSESFISVWPFLTVCIIFALVSGAAMWLLDTWSNKGDFPRAFFPGVYQGFWWSFVSMTAVGYGDKAPKSFCGRLFSIFWIVIGILMISILTSIMASSLTDATVVQKVEMTNKDIGYIPGSGNALSVISDNNGNAKAAKDVIELENWLARGKIIGFVMEKYLLQSEWKARFGKLTGVKYVLENIFNNQGNRKFGISFYPSSGKPIHTKWKECLVEYIKYNVNELDSMERHYRSVYLDKFDSSLFMPPGPKSITLFDPKSDLFAKLFWILFAIIIAIVVAGLIYEACRLYFFGENVISMRDQLGRTHNAGYNASGESTGAKVNEMIDKKMTKEEKQIQELVEKVIVNTETRMQETERAMKNEIREMVRSIRRQITDMKRRQEKDFAL